MLTGSTWIQTLLLDLNLIRILSLKLTLSCRTQRSAKNQGFLPTNLLFRVRYRLNIDNKDR